MLIEDIPVPIKVRCPKKLVFFGLYDKENEISGSCDLYSYAILRLNQKEEIIIKLENRDEILKFIEKLRNENSGFFKHNHYKLEIYSDINICDNSIFLCIVDAFNKFFNSDHLKLDFDDFYVNLFGGIYYINKIKKTHNLISNNEILLSLYDIGKIIKVPSEKVDKEITIDYKKVIQIIQKNDILALINEMNNISKKLIDLDLVCDKFKEIFEKHSSKSIGIKPIKIDNKEFLCVLTDSMFNLPNYIKIDCFFGCDGLYKIN